MQITKNRPTQIRSGKYKTRKSSYEAKLETLKRKEIRKFKYQKH